MNLDGVVNALDYFRIDNGFLSHVIGYFNGDLNYDGKINALDYFLIDSAFLGQSGVVGDLRFQSSDFRSHVAVPEPGWGAVVLGVVGVMAGRRRMNHEYRIECKMQIK